MNLKVCKNMIQYVFYTSLVQETAKIWYGKTYNLSGKLNLPSYGSTGAHI
jgi:hypothetical protein